MAKQVDYLIIGQGLAGSLLSWELIQQGASIHLIDNQQENASHIAAGLINPITGMRLVKNRHIDTLLPCAKQTYHSLGTFFQQDFYIEKSMQRILRSDKESVKFQQRLQDEHYRNYLAPELKLTPAFIQAPLGIITQKHTGFLLTQPLLRCLKYYLQEKQSYQATQFHYSDLQFNQGITWQDITATKIIFCEGYQAIYNPWFKSLPFQLAKGEILTLTTPNSLPTDLLLNYGHWFIPINDHEFRTGATFDTIHLDTQPTKQAKATLLKALTQVIPSLKTAILTQQHANIRPTTRDKAPFIGQHPSHSQLCIFNGFGAKGSLQIPYYSQQFVQHLLHQAPLSHSVDCQRHAE